MAKSVRSVAIEAIEAWRATLPERQRKRLIHPLSVTRRWRQSLRTTGHSADVATYFRTFVNAARKASVQDVMLPADDLAFARAWLAAVPVRVISSPDRPNTRPPQRYRATGPAA